MRLVTITGWPQAALAASQAYPADYVDVAAWLAVAKEADFADEIPIALVDFHFAVFEFATANLCALAIGAADEITLTHIFIKSSPAAIAGRRAKAAAAAQAIGITPSSIT